MGLRGGEASGRTHWGRIQSDHIDDRAVTADKIASNAIQSGHIGHGEIYSPHIADGAVTIDKTDGVVGMVPVGSADATTYANFWIE